MTMATTAFSLIDRLPRTRGTLKADAPLATFTWFRVGGPAEVLFNPVDADDLSSFLAACPADVPVTVIGVASNLLVRDGGVPGVVVRLGRPFGRIGVEPHDDHARVVCGGGAMDVMVARAARDAGLAGLEFLSGIPGTIGGAVRMNAGAYGGQVSDVLASADIVDRSGERYRLTAAGLGLSYRHSELPADSIVTGAQFNAAPGDRAEIAQRMDAIADARAASQPFKLRTGGSTFANPPGEKAWQLIDQAGCRGLTVGGAQVSELHCNFLINTGSATAADIETLGEEVRTRVLAESGIELRWEIQRIGVEAPTPWHTGEAAA